MRALPPQHGRTHALGGSDPVWPSLPCAFSRGNGAGSLAGSSQWAFATTSLLTNDPRTFEVEAGSTADEALGSISDAGALKITRPGIYRFELSMDVSAQDAAQQIEAMLYTKKSGGSFLQQSEGFSDVGPIWQRSTGAVANSVTLGFRLAHFLNLDETYTPSYIWAKPAINIAAGSSLTVGFDLSIIRVGDPIF